MTLNITKEAYTKLIQEDINFLCKNLPSNTQQSVELEHIMLVLCTSIDMLYPGEIKARMATSSEMNKLKELWEESINTPNINKLLTQ